MRYGGLLPAFVVFVAGCASTSLDTPKPALSPTTIADSDPEIAGRKLVAVKGSIEPVRAGTISSSMVAPGLMPTSAQNPLRTKQNLYDVVTVLWGTDRKIDKAPIETSSVGKQGSQGATATAISAPGRPVVGAARGDKLTVGSAEITVPRIARAAGTIARPRYTFLNIAQFTEAEDPAKHFTIGNIATLDRAAFKRNANGILDDTVRFKDQAFIFVHGYNSSFDDALYRTAQIAHDLEFDGLPALYSWPSKGARGDYSYDLNSAIRSQRFFIEFLKQVASDTNARQIHIIAHSLGNRPLLEALRTLQQSDDRALMKKIGQIVFAAPDVDRDLFTEITRRLKLGKGRTLYASNEDKALRLSKQSDGVPRAGDVPAEGPVVIAGLDTIDISEASTKVFLAFNHSDYAERSHVIKDIQLLLKTGTRPPDIRFPVYRSAQVDSGQYWKYVPNR